MVIFLFYFILLIFLTLTQDWDMLWTFYGIDKSYAPDLNEIILGSFRNLRLILKVLWSKSYIVELIVIMFITKERKEPSIRAWEMIQWLRKLTALPKDPDYWICTHLEWLIIACNYDSIPGDSTHTLTSVP